MKGAAAFLLLALTRASASCTRRGVFLVCSEITTNFDPGVQNLVLNLKDVGEINATALQNSNLGSIISLDMNANGIASISDRAFSSFTNLRNLSLVNNMLSRFSSSWFADASGLQELTLTENRLEAVESFWFQGLGDLLKLSLNRNVVSRLHPDSFVSLSSLVELDLSENNLTWVSPRVFRPLRSLRSIGLHGNPWNCSCSRRDFVDAIKELQRKSLLSRPGEVTCGTPRSLIGQPVWSDSVCSSQPWTPTEATPTGSLSSHTSVQLEATAGSGTSASTGLPFSVISGTSPAGRRGSVVVYTLVTVIAVLCVLLFAVCFLAYRKHRGAVVPQEKKPQVEENTNREKFVNSSDRRGLQFVQRNAGVRAKSANAVIITSQFGFSERLKSESPTESSQEVGDGEQEAAEIIQMEQKDDENESTVADTAPYLSIGTNKQSPDVEAHKVLRRISTWPPSAAQWRTRCKIKEEETGEDAVWTVSGELKLSTIRNQEELQNPEEQEDKNLSEVHVQMSDSFILTDELSRDRLRETAAGRTEAKKRALKAGGSKAPSGGGSPDDATLLSGNEYAFMDLLHEVAQNNGRWTRERWKQMQVKKQRK